MPRPRTLALLALVALGPLAPAGARAADDPLAARQWALGPDSSLDAPAAWSLASRLRPAAPVVVAVVDSGIDVTQPDLARDLWTNPHEIPGNGLDDDHDGIADDVHGANLVADDEDLSDGDGHGTRMAGIIGARTGNGVGVAAIGRNVLLMAVRVVDANGNGSPATLAAGIRYAVEHGARIVNVSLNVPTDSPQLESALALAERAGALVVASAGNDGDDLDRTPSFPASSPAPNVLTVGSVGYDGTVSPFSNIGRRTVDLFAPGEDVLTTAPGDRYREETGTSVSAAEVSSAAALLAGAQPGATWRQLRRALLAGTERVGDTARYGAHGALDVAAALRAISPALASAERATAARQGRAMANERRLSRAARRRAARPRGRPRRTR